MDAVRVADDATPSRPRVVGRALGARVPAAARARTTARRRPHRRLRRARRLRPRRSSPRVRAPVTRRMLVEAVWRASWPHDRLVLGASRLIREARPGASPGKQIPVHANRGLAGIDGTIATATGIALASQADGDATPASTRVLLGDLALLHDVGVAAVRRWASRARASRSSSATTAAARSSTVSRSPRPPDPALSTACCSPRSSVDLARSPPPTAGSTAASTTRGELDPALTATAGPVLIEVPLRALTVAMSTLERMNALLRVGADFDLGRRRHHPRPRVHRRQEGRPRRRSRRAADELADLQERLFAASKFGGTRSVLLVLQAMDTAGKGGIVKHVVGSVDPQGVHIHAFKAPTDEEKAHDFLWRVRNAAARRRASIGVFDRSHYEDVLIHRVRGFSTPEVIEERYGIIADFEKRARRRRHHDRQGDAAHLAGRAEGAPRGAPRRPDKHWKYNPGDIDERELWPQYMEAYEIALTPHLDRRRPVVRRSRRPQVVRAARRAAAAARCAARAGAGVAGGGLRRRGREGAARGLRRARSRR